MRCGRSMQQVSARGPGTSDADTTGAGRRAAGRRRRRTGADIPAAARRRVSAEAVRQAHERLLPPASTISRSSASRRYIKSFPKSDHADDAQVYIGNRYLQDGKNDKAVEAYDLAIRTYPERQRDSRRVLQEGARAARI